MKLAKVSQVQKQWDDAKKQELGVLAASSKSYNHILMYLENEIEMSKKMTDFNYKLACFKNDGVYQLHRAIEEIIGVSSAQSEKQPSGGESNIRTVDVQLANGMRIKVPYGEIALPNMGKGASVDISYNDSKKVLYIKGSCQFKFQHLMDEIVDRTKELLRTDSIYKDQAIEISADVNDGQPTILNLSNIDNEVMILSDETEYALSPLKARILHPEKCRQNNIPIKFGALLEGTYGTGKTLLAFKLAKEAIENNWSFIYLKSPELLADTLRMSKTLDMNGNGIIVFTEDIDQVLRGERNTSMQDILNTLDGGDTKNMNVIALFTTNHIELIEPTFLRGKRIGTIISMTYLNAETAKKYINHFCDGITLEGDFNAVYQMIENNNIAPAFMAEIIENVKSNMVIRGDKNIKAEHFIVCIKSYLRQVELSKTRDTSITKEMRLASSLRDVLHDDVFYNQIAEKIEAALD